MKKYWKHFVLAAVVLAQVVICAAFVYADDMADGTAGEVPVSAQADAANGYTGLQKDADGVWRYYTNGAFDNTKTGVVMYGEGWFYVTNGVLDTAFVGLVPYNGGVFYVTAGQVRTEVTGLVASTDGNWYYLSSGQVRTDYTGLVQNTDGQWYYVTAGQVRTDITGLVQNTDGRWFYLSSGWVRTDYSGLVWYNDNCYIIKAGELDTSANGIIMDKGYEYYASYGQIQLGLTGLVQNVDGKWYYISSGQVRWDYNGLALYNGNWFVIKEGMLHTGFNGLYSYNNELFLFTDGTMRIDYTGYQTLDGVTYYIAAGQVYSSNKVFNNGSIAENTCPICGRTLVNGQCDVIHTYGYGWSVYNKATDSVYIVCDSCQQAWPMTVFPDVYEFGNVHGRPCYNEYHKTYIYCGYCYKRFEEGTEPEFMKQTGYCSEECMMNTGYYCPVCKSPLYVDGCHNCGAGAN